MLDGFERFTEIGGIFSPKVSIRKSGQIGFNNGAVRRFDIQHYCCAVLFYHSQKSQMAIKLTDDENEPGAFKIIHRAGNCYISGKSFLDYYGIPYDKSRALNPEWNSDHHVLVVNLKDSRHNYGRTSSTELEDNSDRLGD